MVTVLEKTEDEVDHMGGHTACEVCCQRVLAISENVQTYCMGLMAGWTQQMTE